jgi:hypothetical protein
MQPAFHRAEIARYVATMREVAVPRISGWPDGGTLALDREMRSITLTVLTRTLLSGDIGADAIDEIERLLRVLLSELVARGITANVPGLAWVPTRSNRRFSAANRRLRALLTGIIDGYRRAGADHDDLIGTDASYETLSRLPFTRAVITEALPGHRLQQERYAGNILPPDLGRRSSLSVAETVEEPAEDATFPGESGAGWRCHGPLASDRLVIVCPGDSVNDLGLVEVLGAVDLRHVANQHAVTHDLGLEARGTVGIPLGFAAAGQRYANAELAHATPEKVSVNATVTKGIDHPAGPEFVHARKLALVSE